ncbi:protoporphyrinogen oxidase [Brevibacterium litoralis]|uniref:protoporphyrinogen oxidase n=1 Tax=Brevibacterium litoralis TaxID=3138935 RepID=UPI0032F065C4
MSATQSRPATGGQGARAPRVLVVGAGISGLTAAHRILTERPDVDLTVVESRDRIGGLLKPTSLGGLVPEGADIGAEACLARRPEAFELAAELGLEPEYPDPAQSSSLFAHRQLHPIPPGTLMGVPEDPSVLDGLLSPDQIERAKHELLTDAEDDGDTSVGRFLAERLGDALVDTVVDPLLSGVYAGRSRDLSLAATIPALLPAFHEGTSVLDRVAEVRAQKAAGGAGKAGGDVPGTQDGQAPPVFMSIKGGVNRLAATLAAAITSAGGTIELQTAAKDLWYGEPGTGSRWIVECEDLEAEETVTHLADHLVLAVPAYAAGPLLEGLDDPRLDRSVRTLRDVEYASSALVTAVIGTPDGPPEGSGFLVPPTEPAFIKAATFSSNKWPWLRELLPEDTAVVRMSIGRFGDPPNGWQKMSDGQVAENALADLRRITGKVVPAKHVEVQRWSQAIPQYFPGHLDRFTDLDHDIRRIDGLALVGNVHSGVGIPACIGRARDVADRLLATF